MSVNDVAAAFARGVNKASGNHMTTVDGEPTFVPASITVEAGDTVRWVNTDLHLEHSVTSGSGSADPGSGVDFSSPLLRLGE